jgi:DNA-binding phage protein
MLFLVRLDLGRVKRYCISMPYAEPSAELRAALRRAIKKEGLHALAKRAGVQPTTLQRLAHSAGKTHSKTLQRVQKALT